MREKRGIHISARAMSDYAPSPLSIPQSNPALSSFDAEKAETKIALPPFDAEKADVILLTSDNVEFRVFKLVLSLASPFFQQMFGLPQAPSADEVQVIPVQEESIILDKLLRFCYPCAPPTIDTLDKLHTVMEALSKYQMFNDSSDLVKEAQYLLRSFARTQPVAVFAIACQFGWLHVAQAAARHSLAFPLRKFDDKQVTVKELQNLTGAQHQALLRYHAQCAAGAAAAVSDFRWLGSDGWVWFSCQACLPHPVPQAVRVVSRLGYGPGNETRHVRRWFVDFMERSSVIVAESPKAVIGTVDLLTMVLKQTHGCVNCGEQAFEQLLKFLNNFLEPKIEEEVGKVSLELTL
ncbi:hypothetical protein DFH06DRAFT_1090887 [Mycena polygramma]|nr:hypothetical protein DFH06DRAFT_1090887 [Mycena polygramma]